LKKQLEIFIALVLGFCLFAACSVKKNTAVSRSYHNLTARYNVLFNGRESFRDGIQKAEEAFRPDYSNLLPVFIYKDKETPATAGGDMERTIKKCSKLVSLHSITVKPRVKNPGRNISQKQREFLNKREYNLFVDDAYLLMGKAHFYKMEYGRAEELFRMMLNDFRNQPILFEVQVWLARIMIETDLYTDAGEMLASLEKNPDFPKSVLAELYPTLADLHLARKEYPQAILYLQKALPYIRDKYTSTRYHYLLAQLFERTGELKKASDAFEQVIQMNPDYEMAFNAKISRALAYQQGFGQAEDIEQELVRMIRDDKNIDYQDQIYFALGNLMAKEGKRDQAIQYYGKSALVSTTNTRQKTRSYLTLADLYYQQPDYPNAQAFYDSTLLTMDADYPGYAALVSKTKTLTELVENIRTVAFEDSVQMLARLPEYFLFERIDKLIDAERERREIEKQREQEAQLNAQFSNETAVQNAVRQQNTAEGARWYFYNDAAKSLGFREFKVKYGNRKLEDNWQRANKAAIFIAATDETDEPGEGGDSTAVNTEQNPLSRAFYLANIPRTDSAVSISNEKIENALYNLGMLYRNELKDLNRSYESLQELVKRFPQSEFLMSAYFNLYGISRDLRNEPMADFYRNELVARFPESMYARVLTNPGYLAELEESERRISAFYAETYALFQSARYPEVITRTAEALENYPNHPLAARFAYLSVLSKGKSLDKEVFREKLLDLILQYPKTEIAADAQNLIAYLNRDHPELVRSDDLKASRKLYTYNPDESGRVCLVVDKKINSNQLIFNVLNFNLDNFDALGLQVDLAELNTKQNLLVIRSFTNSELSAKYLSLVKNDLNVLKDIQINEPVWFSISESNYQTLLTDKSAERYLMFYTENYRE